jgi:hypothetical protein
MFGQMEDAPNPYPGSSPTPTPSPSPSASPAPSGTQLVSGTVMTANSQNFAAENPIDRLWDKCTTAGSCSAGTGTASSFWVEFDFGQPYALSTARLFGDIDGNWSSSSWSLQYKQNASDAWTSAFTNANAFMNDWSSQTLSNITARYVRVTVNGNTATNATEARELEIYGSQTTSTPTPTPSSSPVACSLHTPTTPIPTGFGSPFDVVSSPSINLMNAICDVSSAKIDLGKGDPLQYIYNIGYLFKTGATSWSPITFTSTEQLISNAWYPKSASTNIAMTSTELANPSYVLGYVCSWTGSQWKCGCRDQSCPQSYWQIQSFKR